MVKCFKFLLKIMLMYLNYKNLKGQDYTIKEKKINIYLQILSYQILQYLPLKHEFHNFIFKSLLYSKDSFFFFKERLPLEFTFAGNFSLILSVIWELQHRNCAGKYQGKIPCMSHIIAMHNESTMLRSVSFCIEGNKYVHLFY